MRYLALLGLCVAMVGCGHQTTTQEGQRSEGKKEIVEDRSEPEGFGANRISATQTVSNEQQHFATAQEKAEKAATQQKKFYSLGRLAKEAFVAGKINDARESAEELLTLIPLPRFQRDWNYGNAIQDANLVLGRIAVQEGRVEDGKEFLKKAGQSHGSPQMNSFGPNLSLAKDLLEKGERDAVLEYFEACRKFWKMGGDKLDKWSKEVKAGAIPDFGANLIY